MSKRVSYQFEDKPLSGRNLNNEKPCHCDELIKALEVLKTLAVEGEEPYDVICEALKEAT